MKVRSFLLSALCVVTCVMFLTGCGDSPESAVKNWQAAIREGNKPEANKYVTGKDAAEYNEWVIRLWEMNKNEPELKKVFAEWDAYDFSGATISGDTATMITPSVWGNSEKEKLSLKKVDGKWKIDLDASSKR